MKSSILLFTFIHFANANLVSVCKSHVKILINWFNKILWNACFVKKKKKQANLKFIFEQCHLQTFQENGSDKKVMTFK